MANLAEIDKQMAVALIQLLKVKGSGKGEGRIRAHETERCSLWTASSIGPLKYTLSPHEQHAIRRFLFLSLRFHLQNRIEGEWGR